MEQPLGSWGNGKLLLLLTITGLVMGEGGGSSVSGVSVSCYNEMETCLASCQMSCYVVDHCNDSPNEMIACAPNVSHAALLELGRNLSEQFPPEWNETIKMIILTLIFVVAVLACCCTICFCSPCCCLAVWMKKRRERRRRTDILQQQSLIQKA